MKLETAIGRALDAVRSSNPLEATRLIQEALRGSRRPQTRSPQPPLSTFHTPETLDRRVEQSGANKPRRRSGLGKTLAALRSFSIAVRCQHSSSGHHLAGKPELCKTPLRLCKRAAGLPPVYPGLCQAPRSDCHAAWMPANGGRLRRRHRHECDSRGKRSSGCLSASAFVGQPDVMLELVSSAGPGAPGW